MNILHIVVPFFFYSFTTKFVSDKFKEKCNYNVVLYLSLLLSACVSYFASKGLVFEHVFFACCLTLFFLQSLTKNKYIKFCLEASVLIIITGVLYYLSIDCIQTLLIMIMLIIIFLPLGKSKDVPYTLSQIIPVGLLGMYLTDSNILYVISFMTLLGTIRFFIEQPKIKDTRFLTQSFMLILLILIISFNKVEFNGNLSLIIASFSFVAIDLTNRLVLRKNNPLIQRMHLTQLLTVVNLFKAILFNIIAVIIFALAKYGLISYYISLAAVIIIAIISSLKLWYSEHEGF
ncbi:MAG: hypothetical protein GY793_10620 [Proteobacteria bacterium]|nr:hypothetical protein [Pseudomonadota bacterium]